MAARAQSPASGVAPFILDGNRVYARVEFVLPDGSFRKTLLFVDPGSPTMVLSKGLLEELHARSTKALALRIGELTIPVDAGSVTSDTEFPFSLGDREVEGLLPAGVMLNHQGRFDYARHTLTFARPGTLRPEGAAVPLQVNEKTGLIAVEATIDGKTYPITVDNGSGYTWIRKSTAREWLSEHADWQRGTGAVGPSNMRMADDGIEAAGVLIRLPEIKLGLLVVERVGALAIGPDKAGHDLMDWYSSKNALPVIGWLGGNVLRGFRITIDYPERVSYWVRQNAPGEDLDYIGLTLTARDGDYFVAGIASHNGKPAVEGVQAGDKLIQIGALRTHGAARQAIFAAMHGRAGERRSLILERNGRQIQLEASVIAF